ncbi:MAG TPA: DUF389 domain-containing protein [Acidobacteriaceae bacterium]|nr:DUF389 domain-containing protein [Acidobacteriaceae bacterium]
MSVSTDSVAGKRTYLQRWLRIEGPSRPRVYVQVYATAEMLSLNYWLEIVLSAGIATLGLVENSPAVIIGAMLISPLMGPIMATGMGLGIGDLFLTAKAIANLMLSVTLAVGLSALFVWLLPFHSATNEILSRTNPTLLDLGIALLSGLAGAVAVARSGGGGDGVATLPGVAIAVALMPPLCTIGFGLGSGANLHIMAGAGLLFLTNLVAIVSSAFAVFLLIGMNAPDVRPEVERSHAKEPLVKRFAGTSAGRMLTTGGALHWRIVMLVVLLATVGWPLRSALRQLAGEAVAREAVQAAVRKLVPAADEVSRQVEVGRGSIAVRLVATEELSDAQVRQAEREIERRTGRKTDISVASVASQSELAGLMQRLAAPVALPPPPPPKIVPLADVRDDLLARVQPALTAVWPAEVPVQSYALSLSADGVTLNVTYAAVKPVTPISLGILQKDLQTALTSPSLTLQTKRVAPPKTGKAASHTARRR